MSSHGISYQHAVRLNVTLLHIGYYMYIY